MAGRTVAGQLRMETDAKGDVDTESLWLLGDSQSVCELRAEIMAVRAVRAETEEEC